MEMEVPVENNVSIGNGISSTMPLHVNRSVPLGVGATRSDSRERDIGGNNYLNSTPNLYGQQSANPGFGPPSYGSGIVTNNYYAPAPAAPLPPPSAHPRDRGDTSANISNNHREREIIRESIGNRPPPMFKIAVVGESTVGKSTICNVFTSDASAFSKNYNLTRGVDVFAKNIKLPTPSSSTVAPTAYNNPVDEGVNLVLLDSSGKDIYIDLLPRYWDKIDGLALIVDLTMVSSLENAQRWLDLAKSSISNVSTSSSSDNFLGVLIGNKSDLTEERTVSPKMAKDFAQLHHLEYFECSAKENNGLEEPFFYLAHQWASRAESGGTQSFKIPNSTINNNKENQRDKDGHRGGAMSSVGSSRHSAFQRKSSSNSPQSQSQGSLEFI